MSFYDAVAQAHKRANKESQPMAIYKGKRKEVKKTKSQTKKSLFNQPLDESDFEKNTCWWVLPLAEPAPQENKFDSEIKLFETIEPEK